MALGPLNVRAHAIAISRLAVGFALRYRTVGRGNDIVRGVGEGNREMLVKGNDLAFIGWVSSGDNL